MSSSGAVIKSANTKYIKENKVIIAARPVYRRIHIKGYIILFGKKTFYRESMAKSMENKNPIIDKDEIIKNLESEIARIKLELLEFKNEEKAKEENNILSSKSKENSLRYKYPFSMIKSWKEEKPDNNINLII